MLIKGVKVDFQSTYNEKDGIATKLTPSYKCDSYSGQTSVLYPVNLGGKKNSQPIKWISEFVFQLPRKIYFGLNFLVDFETNQTKQKTETAIMKPLDVNSVVAARASYVHQDESLVWGFSFFHKLSKFTKWCADYEFDSSKGPTAQIGGKYKVDKDTTLKGRAVVKSTEVGVSDYRLGLSLKQKVSKHVTATIGADVNVRQILGVGIGELHSIGCEVVISDD